MTIQKINSYLTQLQQHQKVSDPTQVQRTDGKSSSSKGIPAATDSVQLSKKSQEMDQMQKAAAERGQLRNQHIAQLQSQVQGNSYTVQPDKVAHKMLQEIF